MRTSQIIPADNVFQALSLMVRLDNTKNGVNGPNQIFEIS